MDNAHKSEVSMDVVLNAIAYLGVVSSSEIKDEIGQQKRVAISFKTSELIDRSTFQT